MMKRMVKYNSVIVITLEQMVTAQLTSGAGMGSFPPTFYEQLFHQFSFAKKLQTQTVSYEKHFFLQNIFG